MTGVPRKNEFGEHVIYVIFTIDEYLPILKRVITETLTEWRIQTMPTQKGTILVTEFDFDGYFKVVEALKSYNLGLTKYRDGNLIWELVLLK